MRLYTGSLMGLARDSMHTAAQNPFARIFLDEPIDGERLETALREALEFCPYMNCSVVPDEGFFLKTEENRALLPLQKEEPAIINTPENNGHSCAVSYQGNRISVMVTHALTDGGGLFFFVRTLLDRYFGENAGCYLGAKEPDYAKDLLEEELPVSEGFKPWHLPEGSFFTIQNPKKPDFSNTFLLQTPYADFKALCKKLNGSVQNVLTALSFLAVFECWPKNGSKITARLPVNARSLMGIPHTFQNASLANMRVTVSPEENPDPEALVRSIASQCAFQNTKDAVAYQYGQWRLVLEAENGEERMKRIFPLLGPDALLVSNLGKGLASDTYADHICAVLIGSMMFPLMLYGLPLLDRMGFSGYDGSPEGGYRDALKAVLERVGLTIEERDTETGKTV